MKDRSDDPSHHERTLSLQSYISLSSIQQNAFYLLLYGIRYIVKEHTYNERGILLLLLMKLWLLFPINSKGSFIYIIQKIGEYIPQPLLYQLWTLAGRWLFRNKSNVSKLKWMWYFVIKVTICYNSLWSISVDLWELGPWPISFQDH